MKADVPGTSSDVHIRFEGVSKRYGSVLAVDDFDLEIRRGEFLTLLGPSGSGKTTALMMLAGFEEPSSGSIAIDGRRIDKVPPNRRGIGMVFQNYALFPHMTVAENLAFPLQVRKLSKSEIEERVAEVLDMVRLPGLGGRRPEQLSGGQQQRVAVARALIFRPNLVLMDEPLGALDKQLREQMQYEIMDIHSRLGVTFVYVTHDQTEALTMSDRIAVFNAGTIQQLSAPAALYERPQTGFVAGFIGENNRFDGVVECIEDSQLVVRTSAGARLAATGVGEPLPKVGEPVTLSMRPERVLILRAGATHANEVAATVRQVVYVGDHIRVICAAAGLGQVIVKLGNDATLKETVSGEEIRLGWRAEDCLALPEQNVRAASGGHRNGG